MKIRLNTLALSAAMATTLLALFAVGCSKTPDIAASAAPNTTMGTDIDDSVITSSVKAALLADTDIKSFDFKVETRKGQVLLSGFVDNQAQLDRAKATTLGVSGVKGIQNNVSLKGTPTTVGSAIDDGIITGLVKAALLGDEQVKSLDIAVVTNKAQVQLSGYVNNQAQIDRAFNVTQAVQGVQSVRNEMTIKK